MKTIIFFLIFFLIIPGFIKSEGIITSCKEDNQCQWISTNCCPENAGANWECINKEIKIECPENPICLQVVRPKPSEDCLCIDNKCQKVSIEEKEIIEEDRVREIRLKIIELLQRIINKLKSL